MKRLEWLIAEIKWLLIGAVHTLTGKYLLSDHRYGKKRLYQATIGNDKLYEFLSENKPFAYCRFSYTEMSIMIHSQTEEYFGIPTTRIINWLDIFCDEGESNSIGAKKYRLLMSEAFKNADIIGVWKNLHMGDALLNVQNTLENVCVSEAQSVESYYFDKPWTSMLKNKKVLVVSPFSEIILKQYEKREHIWDNKDILPAFDLSVEDSIWYYAGERDYRFSNWFQAYDYLYERIMSHDFDVAILGCGYFGFSLASRIKQAGKQAIHMGGATQLLFGIKGKRWDNNPNINRFYNEYWVRPYDSKKPVDDKNLDNGCYW